MLWNNPSFTNLSRGKSVGGNMYSTVGRRYMQPKFMKGVCQEEEKSIKDKMETRKIVMKKQNIAPVQSHHPKSKQISLRKSHLNDNYQKQQTLQKTESKDKPKLKICHNRGLHNIGNTCYMNSTLQCLFHLPVFNSQLLKQCSTKSSKVAQQYANIVLELIAEKKGNPINPSQFKKTVGKKKPRFLGSSQQDAQQFLTSFLEIVNEELTRIKGKGQYKELENDPTKKPISQLSQEWWEYYMARDNSVICDIFQGQVISTVSCKKCSKQSVTFDNLWGVPVTIHKSKSVYDLLSHHWQSQSLIDDYHCSKCNKTRMCSKTLNLYKIPKVLVVQLKRFEYGRFLKQKKNDSVKIDTEIDIQNFVSSYALKANKMRTKYKLRGIIHHFGEVDYGHYTADILNHNDNKWYEMNDSRFQQTSCPNTSKTAYLLFYEQIA